MLSLRGENPPIATVLKVCITASSGCMPASSSRATSSADMPTYSSHRILAVWAMRGVSLSTVGPGASLRSTFSPPIPMRGRIATVSTTIPMPPSHCISERQNSIERGSASMSVRIVAPVVVKPDIASKKASA